MIDADLAEVRAEELARALAQRAAYFEDGPDDVGPSSGEAVPVPEPPAGDGLDGTAA